MKSKKTTKADSPRKDEKEEIYLISTGVDQALRDRWVSLVFLGIAFLLAFFIRLSFLKYYYAPLAGDAAIYGKIAWGIKNGHGLHWWSMVWPPFYPFMIFLFSLVVGSLESAAFAVSLFLGSLVVVPFFFLAKRVFDYRSAYLGSVLMVFFPGLIETSAVPLSEATYTFFVLVAVFFGWLLVSKRSHLYGALFGILSGICYLTRPEFLAAFACLLLAFLVFEVKSKVTKKSRTLTLLVAGLVGFGVVALPYLDFMHSQSGHWILSGKTAHNVLKQKAYSKGLNYLEQRRAFSQVLDGLTPEGEITGKVLLGEESITGFIASPGFFGDYYKSVWAGMKKANFFILPFLFLSLFYVFSWKLDKEGWRKRVFLLCVFSPILTMPIFLAPAGRLIVPYASLLILLSVRGILSARKSLAKLTKNRSEAPSFALTSFAAFLVVVLLSAFSMIKAHELAEDHQKAFEDLKFRSEEFKKLGLWADRNLPKEVTVLFLSGDSFFFYCNRVTLLVPFAPFERIVQFAKENKAEYLIVSLGKEASWREDLLFLWEPLKDPLASSPDPRLKLIDVYSAPSGLVALMYQLVF